jgi:hypothetical protein
LAPGCPWAQVAAADDAALMYDPSKVYAIDLDLPQASIDELEEHHLRLRSGLPRQGRLQGQVQLRQR